MPVFPYYWLLQANGPCGGCGEAEKDLAHLDDPTLMRRSYASPRQLGAAPPLVPSAGAIRLPLALRASA